MWERMNRRYPRTMASTLGTAAGGTVALMFGWAGLISYLCGALAIVAVCARGQDDD